ncbi:MAG: ATP-binding protein [bacterium]|nr:ATP-binding protein [bacterium]
MRIKEIAFKDHRSGWELEKTAFSDLTLLVGATGVGKTRILNAIMTLVKIGKGFAYNGVEWDFRFTSLDKEECRWLGKYESVDTTDQKEFLPADISGGGKNVPKILEEKLYVDGELVFERDKDKLLFEKKETPRVSSQISILNLFMSETKVIIITSFLLSIVLLDYKEYGGNEVGKTELQEMAGNIKGISNWADNDTKIEPLDSDVTVIYPMLFSTHSSYMKLTFLWKYYSHAFDEIIAEFKNIFPQIEEARFQLIKDRDVYELQIRERGTEWIPGKDIASGMLKTLMHLSALKMTSSSSVILIDEFENSLGANCIDAVAGSLLGATGEKPQYIITSHHPYIINTIPMKYWKIVVRKGSKVSTLDAAQLKLGKSKHEAFMQLMNRDEFTEGIS